MDIKILIASFALVFVAELGDKTQLTAMALTTSSKSGWMVFAGTSLALIATTALAVLFGAALTRWVPLNVLHIGSAVAFILIGLVLLVNVARKAPAPMPAGEAGEGEVATATAYEQQDGGLVYSWASKQAVVFEEEIIDYLQGILPRIDESGHKQAITEIIAEDRKHRESLLNLETIQDKESPAAQETSQPEKVSLTGQLKVEENYERPFKPEEARAHIEKAVTAEEHLADFYLELARKAKLHAAKDAFRWLAMEDIRHAQRLCSLINPDEELTS